MPEGLNSGSSGLQPTVAVPTTVLVATSTTLIVPEALFVIYANVPSGLNATPCGEDPPIWLTTVLVATFITVTLLSEASVAYARVPDD